MKTSQCICFLTVLVVAVAAGNHLPKTFKTCKKSDSDYKTCLRNAVENALQGDLKQGIPDLGLQTIDPLFVEKIHIGGNGGKVDIVQDFKDLNCRGFSTSKVNDIQLLLDGDECKITYSAVTPYLSLEGQYKIVGKVLILQINGFGAANITLTNCKTDHVIQCEKIKDKSGKTVLKLKDYTIDLNTEKIAFDFENLVQGNPQLSAEVLKVINESSAEIFEEIRKDYARTFAEIFKRVASHILSKVPYDEYYLA